MLIVDTINEAFDTRDEQDNAEANRQFACIKRLRDETGCSILLLAHLGKGDQTHKVYSTRGASARAASVDVVLNLTEITQDEVCLSKEKDRIGGGKEKLYLRKAGEDAFEVMEKGEDQEISLLVRAEKFILASMDEGLTQTGQFVECGKQASYSQPTTERALANLRKAGKIDRVKKGIYLKVTEASKPNNYSGDDLRSDVCNMPSENPSITNTHRGDGLMDSLSHEGVEQILGMSVEQALAIWERAGKPLIHLAPGENTENLEGLLSNRLLGRHVKAVAEWLKETSCFTKG